jgi:hypothetical protein
LTALENPSFSNEKADWMDVERERAERWAVLGYATQNAGGDSRLADTRRKRRELGECFAPGKRWIFCGLETQGVALGWYVLPRWGGMANDE